MPSPSVTNSLLLSSEPWESIVLDSLKRAQRAIVPLTKNDQACAEFANKILNLAPDPLLTSRQRQACAVLGLNLLDRAADDQTSKAALDMLRSAAAFMASCEPFASDQTLTMDLDLLSCRLSSKADNTPVITILQDLVNHADATVAEALHILFCEGAAPLASWLDDVAPFKKESALQATALPRPRPIASETMEEPQSQMDLSQTMLVRVVSGAVSAAVTTLGASQNHHAPSKLKPTEERTPRQNPAAGFKRLKPELTPKLVPFDPDAILQEAQQETSWQAKKPVHPHFDNRRRWMQVAAIFALGVVIHFLIELSLVGPGSAHATQSDAIENRNLLPNQETEPSLEIAERFLYSENVEDRAELLRDPRHVGLFRDHLQRMKNLGLEQEVAGLHPMGEVQAGDLFYDRFHVQFTDGRDRLLVVVQEKTGSFVDWEAYARQGSASWEELLEGQVAEAKVRAFVQRSDYYAPPFEDPKRYQSYAITSPDCETTLFGYVRRKTERALLIARELQSSERQQRMTLRLARAEGAVAGDPVFKITKLTMVGWVKGSIDYEESPFAVLVPMAFDEEHQCRKANLDLRTVPHAPPVRDRIGISGEHCSGLPSLSL